MNATNTLSSYSYLIIGSGRVAKHISYYFQLLQISFSSWDRSQDPHALARKVQSASHVLLAISDTALEGFYRQHLAGHDKTVIHFSGAHNFEDMISAHPLMTFGVDLYDLSFYKKIHFTLTGTDSLQDIFPAFTNSFSVLSAEQKPLYHALCVVGGNFSSLLIAKMMNGLAKMNIPHDAAHTYIDKVVSNTFSNPEKALTGPIVRKDIETIKANLDAIKDDPYNEIYQAFLKTYWPDYPRK